MGQPAAPIDPRGNRDPGRERRVAARDIWLAPAAAAPPSVAEPSGYGRGNLRRVLADLLRPTATSLEIDGPAWLRLDAPDAELVCRLLEQARAGGLQLTGQGGLFQQLGDRVLESALGRAVIDQPVHDGREPMDHDGAASRSGLRSAIYPMIFVDAIHVKVRDGEGSDRPIHVALAVTAEGTQDILGLWTGDGC